jgi:hypothetical protein
VEAAQRFAQGRQDLQEEGARAASKAAFFAGIKWEDDGEGSTRWFHRLGLRRRADTTILELQDTLSPPVAVVDGVPQYPVLSLATEEGRDRAGEVIAAFYDGDREGGLFHPHATDAGAQATMLQSVDRTLEPGLRAACEGEGDGGVSVEELRAALRRCAASKAPGCDGLPYEFYMVFWEVVGQPLADVASEALQDGEQGLLPDSMRTGLVVMVYKGKGSRQLLASYRPLTLLCCDYKILAKAITLRFAGPLGTVVDETQTAFIPGRWIGDNVLFHLEEVDYLDVAQQPGCIAFLDFEKAYDRVDRGWVVACMGALGFGPVAISWVQLLLRGTVARCLFNGWRTAAFSVRSGVAQGSPLSPLLYVIAAQPLAARMRQLQREGLVRGISLPDGSRAPPSHQHADDTTLHVADLADLGVAWDMGVRPFCEASGSGANASKTVALLLGTADGGEGGPEGAARDPGAGIRIAGKEEAVRHLGIMLGAGEVGEAARAAKFEHIARGIGSHIGHWTARGLSDIGRAHVARQVMASSLVYHIAFSSPAPDTLRRLEGHIMRFVAGEGGRMYPRRAVAHLPWALGGRGVVCLPAVQRAMQAGIVVRLLHPEWHPWKGLMGRWFDRAARSQGLAYGARLALTTHSMRGEGALPARVAGYVREFRALHPQRALARGDMSAAQVAIEPLFFSPAVTVGGEVLRPGDFPACISAGVTTVGRVHSMLASPPPAPRALDAAVSSELRRIVAALPAAWRVARPPQAERWWLVEADGDGARPVCARHGGGATAEAFVVGPQRSLRACGGLSWPPPGRLRECLVVAVRGRGQPQQRSQQQSQQSQQQSQQSQQQSQQQGQQEGQQQGQQRGHLQGQQQGQQQGRQQRQQPGLLGQQRGQQQGQLQGRQQGQLQGQQQRGQGQLQQQQEEGPPPVLYFVGTLDGDAQLAARTDPSVWAVARQPVLQSTARGRTLHVVQCQAVAAGVGYTYDCALRPPVWRDRQQDGLQHLQQRWADAIAPTLSGHRRGREGEQPESDSVPPWMRPSVPRALPAERVVQRQSQESLDDVCRPPARAWWLQLECVLQPQASGEGSGGAAAASEPAAVTEERRRAAVWGAVWRRLRRAPVPRDHRFLAWRVLHGTLPCAAWLACIGSRAGAAGPGGGEGRELCHAPGCAGAGAVESLSHAFLECPAAAAVAAWVSGLWGAVAQGPGPPCVPQVFLAGDHAVWDPGQGERGALWEILRLAFLSFMWRARAACRLRGVELQPARVAASIVAYLRQRMRQDFARTQDLESTFASLCGHWVQQRPMSVEVAKQRWCRNGVLARFTGDGVDEFVTLLTVSHPVPLPS